MTTSTARVLALLEILQAGGIRTVGDLATRLDVDERTIRRSVKHLLDLDVPVISVRGRYGGYRLAPGYRMPPLMLTNDEALAVLLGLVAGRRSGLFGTSAVAGESAAAKLRRVLPDAVGRRLDALLETMAVTAPERRSTDTEADVLLGLAEAAKHRQPVEIGYVDRVGRRSERTVHPYGVVAHSGRWYLTGADSTSGEDRSFRLDRIATIAVQPGSFDVPAGFDPVTAVVSGLSANPWQHRVSLRILDDVEHLRRHLPASVATVVELDDGWLQVDLQAEKLNWVASTLAALDRPFAVERPAELRDLIRALADRLLEYAD